MEEEVGAPQIWGPVTVFLSNFHSATLHSSLDFVYPAYTLLLRRWTQCSRILIFRIFQTSKNMTFYVFFEMTFQKNVKSHKKYQVC